MITLVDLKIGWRAILLVVVVIIIAVLCVLLARSNAALAKSESDSRILLSDNALQATVITTQAFNFNRFNQVAENASRMNSLIDAGAEKTVIEYREILRREKTCNLPVPADVAGGLLNYAYRLRASAMHTDIVRGIMYTGDTRGQAWYMDMMCEARGAEDMRNQSAMNIWG